MQEMQETWVWSLGREDPLEEEMATQYSCLENPTDRGAWRATFKDLKELDTTQHTKQAKLS